jgi:hypothetical protein
LAIFNGQTVNSLLLAGVAFARLIPPRCRGVTYLLARHDGWLIGAIVGGCAR